MVSFLAAFGWNCFDGSNVATRVVVGAASGALVVLILWCVWMGWVKQPSESSSSQSEGDPTPANADAQSHISSEKVEPASRLASRHSLVTSRPASRISRASRLNVVSVPEGSTVGEMKTPSFWRSWSGFFLFGANRRASLDSQTTAVAPPPDHRV